MWTVANLVARFCDRYEFHIVTRNYDSPGDTEPYTSVKTNEWNDLENCRVYYASSGDLTKSTCARIVNEVAPDCVFLNSVFATAAINFLGARRDGKTPEIPVILAPCGELSVGALSSKGLKKKIFLAYAKITGLYRGVNWKASTEAEIAEIRTVFGNDPKPLIAPDLTPKTILPDFSINQKPHKKRGSARFIFLSRIVQKKNLLFFLKRLNDIGSGDIAVDIVGPQEDEMYWNECLVAISDLPSNIKVNITGSVSYLDGLKRLCESHFFVLPTLNENFGYVFVESLAAGCPIIISDQTVWNEVTERNAGFEIPLANTTEWTETIIRCIDMDSAEYIKMATSARKYAQEWLADTKIEDATAHVLESALRSTSKAQQ